LALAKIAETPIDPALLRLIEALARFEARRDYEAALALPVKS
jgi:hypothetical protein